MSKPRLLDLFCGAGGASVGYSRAGFEVVGIDLHPQPHYPFIFHRGDALDFLRTVVRWEPREWDAVHASPPCQAYSKALKHLSGEYPSLIEPGRELLEATGLPWVIENVPGSPLRRDFDLCGCYFDLPGLRRPRWFETNWGKDDATWTHHHEGLAINVDGHGTPGRVYRAGQPVPTQADRKAAMGVDWMNRNELAEAIPPAFTEYVGKQLMAHLGHGGDVTP